MSPFQDEVLVQNDHAVILSINAPKEVCLFVGLKVF